MNLVYCVYGLESLFLYSVYVLDILPNGQGTDQKLVSPVVMLVWHGCLHYARNQVKILSILSVLCI